MATSSALQTAKSRAWSWRFSGLTCPHPTSHVQRIPRRRWASNCPSWSWSLRTWRSTLHSKCRWGCPILNYFVWSIIFIDFSPGARRQECTTAFPGKQLPVDDPRKALHLHDADATGRGMEPNTIQFIRLYTPGLWNELRGDASSTDPRELPHSTGLLLGPPVQRGRVTGRVQAVPADPETTGAQTTTNGDSESTAEATLRSRGWRTQELPLN